MLLYCLFVAALLPYLYCRAVVDPWHSPCASPLSNWVGWPIAVFTVPTAFFVYDTLTHKQPSLRFYIRSLRKIVLVPIWAFIWGCIELFVLGWVWI